MGPNVAKCKPARFQFTVNHYTPMSDSRRCFRHLGTFAAAAIVAGSLVAANVLNHWYFGHGGSVSTGVSNFGFIGWPSNCISCTETVHFQFDSARKRRTATTTENSYAVLDWHGFLLNVAVILVFGSSTAIQTHRILCRQWNCWRYGLATLFWVTTLVAVILSVIATESYLYPNPGSRPTEQLHPYVRIPVLFGFICSLQVVVLALTYVSRRLRAFLGRRRTGSTLAT